MEVSFGYKVNQVCIYKTSFHKLWCPKVLCNQWNRSELQTLMVYRTHSKLSRPTMWYMIRLLVTLIEGPGPTPLLFIEIKPCDYYLHLEEKRDPVESLTHLPQHGSLHSIALKCWFRFLCSVSRVGCITTFRFSSGCVPVCYGQYYKNIS